jgi:hypothetical protein
MSISSVECRDSKRRHRRFPHIVERTGQFFASLLLISAVSATSWGQLPPSESIVSNAAKGWLSFPDYETLSQRFETTQWGKILQDPQMKPFGQQLRAYYQDHLSTTERQLGIRLDDLKGVARGEIATAAFRWGPEGNQDEAFLLMVDTTNNRAAAEKHVKTVTTALKNKGGVIREQPFEDGKITEATIQNKNNVSHKLEYFVNDEMLLASNNHDLLKDVHSRIRLPNAVDSLGRSFSFETITTELQKAAPALDADVKWFLVPLDYAEIIRDASEKPLRRRRDKVMVMRKQGFDSVQAAGGWLGFAQGGHDATSVAFVHSVEGERTLGASALSFPGLPALPPDQWVPETTGASLEISWRIPHAFEQLKGLVDDWLDQPGYAEAVLDEMAKDPRSLQIDIQRQIVAQMKPRVSVTRDVVLPLTPNSERVIISVPLINPNVLEMLLKDRLKRDSSIVEKNVGGQIIWELKPPKKGNEPSGNGFQRPPVKGKPANGVSEVHAGICISHGRFFYCSDWLYLKEFIQRPYPAANPLDNDADYRRVTAALDELAAADKGAISMSQFRRIADSLRINYFLARQNKVGDSDTLIVKLIRSLVEKTSEGDDAPKDDEMPKFDGSKLPPFAVVEPKLGLSGYRVYTRPEGWMIYSIALPPQ